MNIIVGVVHRQVFQWYVSDKGIWFLDKVKWRDAYRKAGYDVHLSIDDPEGAEHNPFLLSVRSEEAVSVFLGLLEKYKTSTGVLRAQLVAHQEAAAPEDTEDDVLDFVPALLINFDQKTLQSLYPEPLSLEEFVPDGWTGEYKSFLASIPPVFRYWVIDGRDYILPTESVVPSSRNC